MRITLTRLSPPESAGVIGEFVTNDDGRLEGGPALKGGKEFTVGVYEWTFYVADVSFFFFFSKDRHVGYTAIQKYVFLTQGACDAVIAE
jgi:5-hydroxyisourate hydrolase-like protein (transthyretin family)